MSTSTRAGSSRLVTVALAAGAVSLCAGAFGAAQNSPDPACDLTTSERIVAIGDVHGAYERFLAILRAAGLVDGRERWTGGRAILVQTGDVLDRGPDSRKVLDLLRRLERDASRAGGRLHALLGNHEVMRMLGDFRDVSAEEYAAFRTGTSEETRDRVYERVATNAAEKAKPTGQRFDEKTFRKQFVEQTPLGSIEMQIEFGPQGEYGRWLRTHDTMVKINGIVFLHGGISPAIASLGCKAVNETLRSELRAPGTATDPMALSNSETGPLWYRGLALEDETSFAAEVDRILKTLDARAIVIGHTVVKAGRIAARFAGRVVQIDTGMLDGKFYPEGRPSALEIQGGRFTAIYEDRREVLMDGSLARLRR